MKKSSAVLKHLPKILSIFLIGAGLLLHSEKAADGVREGLSLLGNVVIPSLFPFLVLSSYITETPSAEVFCRLVKKPVEAIFKTDCVSALPIIMGAVGGYPVGAKTVASLYKQQRLTRNEAERLMYWCVNAGPAFILSALGAVMLGSIKSGAIVYCSVLLSSFTIGFFCRFLYLPSEKVVIRSAPPQTSYPVIDAVRGGMNAILNISAWVLTFSCISELLETFKLDSAASMFLKCVLEVTTGCADCAKTLPLPVTAAAIGFGGISVICQVSPYLDDCGVQIRRFVTARILNSALCAFYCSQLLRVFPGVLKASVTYGTRIFSITLSYSAPVFAILLIMCAIFILQVDNRKKMC